MFAKYVPTTVIVSASVTDSDKAVEMLTYVTKVSVSVTDSDKETYVLGNPANGISANAAKPNIIYLPKTN
jgi:hypothetical protein